LYESARTNIPLNEETNTKSHREEDLPDDLYAFELNSPMAANDNVYLSLHAYEVS